MRVLWAPWRLSYIEKGGADADCVFCSKATLSGPTERREALVLRSGEHATVLMNLFPYSNAHLLVAPKVHTSDFGGLSPRVSASLQEELQRGVRVLQEAYSPSGFNIGMNLGRAGGAGIADHLHWHIVPRWEGDTNFMPMLADTRVIPEHLLVTYDRLQAIYEREVS